jgi:hypothetical protein
MSAETIEAALAGPLLLFAMAARSYTVEFKVRFGSFAT